MRTHGGPRRGPPRGLGGGLHPLTKSREGSWGGRCSRRPPFPPPLASPPPFQKMGEGDARGGMGEGGRRQRPRLSSTDERCIPSYRGDGESCAAASPPLDFLALPLRPKPKKPNQKQGFITSNILKYIGRMKPAVPAEGGSSFCCAAASPLALLAGGSCAGKREINNPQQSSHPAASQLMAIWFFL
nr:hypothetical protein [Morchella crassipes]